MWTSAPIEDLLPGLREIAASLPPPPSHALWLNWGVSPTRPDMAYSVEDEIYLALYGVWFDEADDARYGAWPAERMGAMADLASGIQLADENLAERPARFLTDANMARLDRYGRPTTPKVASTRGWVGHDHDPTAGPHSPAPPRLPGGGPRHPLRPLLPGARWRRWPLTCSTGWPQQSPRS